MNKRTVVLIATLMLAVVQSYGQDFKRFTVKTWYSPSTQIQTNWYRNYSPVFVRGRYKVGESMAYIYSDYTSDVKSPGIFGASFSYSFKKWFALESSIGFTPVSYSTFDALKEAPTGKVTDCMICFIPEARFTALYREWVRLYGSVGIGICGYCDLKSSVSVALQFVPIGVEVGKSFFGFAELGFGHLYSGIQFGIGYKF
ncbi:MAG: hypothetical protein KBS58_04025 [Bacteroidales bacterium]|nr:hypothetical protein [Candidatus Cacconaster equi]